MYKDQKDLCQSGYYIRADKISNTFILDRTGGV